MGCGLPESPMAWPEDISRGCCKATGMCRFSLLPSAQAHSMPHLADTDMAGTWGLRWETWA